MDEKTARNIRAQNRYDELMHEGKHGHYETMFRVIREEVDGERERCALICERLAQFIEGGQIPRSPDRRLRQAAKYIREPNRG